MLQLLTPGTVSTPDRHHLPVVELICICHRQYVDDENHNLLFLSDPLCGRYIWQIALKVALLWLRSDKSGKKTHMRHRVSAVSFPKFIQNSLYIFVKSNGFDLITRPLAMLGRRSLRYFAQADKR